MTAPLPHPWVIPGGKLVFEPTALRDRGDDLVDVRFLKEGALLAATIVWATSIEDALVAAREFSRLRRKQQRQQLPPEEF